MKQNKILSLVGLATKAGKTASGEFSTEKSVKEGKACLVIVSVESSDNTKKKFTNMPNRHKIKIISAAKYKFSCVRLKNRQSTYFV